MNRRHFVRAAAGVGTAALTGLAPATATQPGTAATTAPDRAEWIARVERVCGPVVRALAVGRLRATMPIESSGTGRAEVTHLEAVGRTLMGLAPWLALPPSTDAEGGRRAAMVALVVDGLELDSKAVVGAAARRVVGRELRPDEFSGGLEHSGASQDRSQANDQGDDQQRTAGGGRHADRPRRGGRSRSRGRSGGSPCPRGGRR